MDKWLLLVIVNSVLIYAALRALGIYVNITPSYPLGFYMKENGDAQKGDLVAACLSGEALDVMLNRQYIPNMGACGNHPPLIKRVVAWQGDNVKVEQNISVNGQVLINSRLLKHDPAGRGLSAAKGGVVTKGHIWLMSTDAKNSYDSRYFGEVPVSNISNKVKAIWVF